MAAGKKEEEGDCVVYYSFISRRKLAVLARRRSEICFLAIYRIGLTALIYFLGDTHDRCGRWIVGDFSSAILDSPSQEKERFTTKTEVTERKDFSYRFY